MKTKTIFKSFGLNESEHQIACELTKVFDKGYYLVKADQDLIDTWIDLDDDPEQTEFLKDAVAKGATIYTLYQNTCGCDQPIGEIAVFD